jgi:protein-L-isoaspartate O-methyltransferase
VWREAFAAVPRHLFVPYYYVAGPHGYERRWGESPDPGARARWVRGAYEDVPLVTRLHDGELVSSSSQPSLMARMLVALEVADGDRVLEVGAGTGYNAALLAHRLGDDDLVTTVDLKPEITESARRHLRAAGFHPAVVTGDGTRGAPEHAPLDRTIATCELSTVPRAWLARRAPRRASSRCPPVPSPGAGPPACGR